METVKNALPKRYRTKFIEPGLADYTAEGFGKVLVSKDALDKMLPSFVGKPVFLEHNDIDAMEAFENGKKTLPPGVVSETGYDDGSGWYWADMIIWDEETQNAIDKYGFTVSCAYNVEQADGKGGSYHAIPYDQEVITGEYTHMAIVNNPRYEGATIVRNSKTQGGKMKFKLLGKKVENQEPEKKEGKEKEEDEMLNAENSVVKMENGETVPVSEMIQAYKNSKNSENVLNQEDEIEVDGETVPVSKLIQAYKSRNNAEPPQDEEAEDVVKMQNSAPEKKQKAKNENFKKIENAVSVEAEPAKPQINTRSERLARGKERYSLGGKK